MELTTSWEEQGIEKGIIIGGQRGEARGINIGRHEILLEQLSYRFKELSERTRDRQNLKHG
ncbi:MAG: hypothetical protein R2865_03475 [Deinococcales bacterium]